MALNSVYAGGLWVRTSVVPTMQEAAANALREGLARFDGGRGWRDLEQSIDVSGDWAGLLDRTPVGTGFPDWRKAVVLSKSGNSAEIGFANGSKGTLPASAASQPKRGGGGSAFSNLRPA
jgi:penicillin-binding protein 1A